MDKGAFTFYFFAAPWGTTTLGCWTNSCCTLTQAKGNICTVSIPSLSGAYGKVIDRVFAQMETVECHVYQVLTKPSLRMRDYLRGRCGNRTAPTSGVVFP